MERGAFWVEAYQKLYISRWNNLTLCFLMRQISVDWSDSRVYTLALIELFCKANLKCRKMFQLKKTSRNNNNNPNKNLVQPGPPLHSTSYTQPNVLRSITEVFTNIDKKKKKVSYCTNGASLLLTHLPLQISAQYQRRTWPLGNAFKRFVHSLQSQQHWREIVMRNTHKNTVNCRTNKQRGEKSLFSEKVKVK